MRSSSPRILHVGGRLKETTMKCGTIGLIVILALSLTILPSLLVEADDVIQ